MAPTDTWRWDEVAFIRAWEAGVFGDQRVELVEGEVWPVSIEPWHGSVTGKVIRALPNGEWRVTTSSLPASGSIVDPDVWVHPRGARPVSHLGATGRLVRWSASDVALVVEVADSSLPADLEIKAGVYGRAGFATYWVVHRNGVEVLTDPYEGGYRKQRTFDRSGEVEVPYLPGHTIAVATILDAED